MTNGGDEVERAGHSTRGHAERNGPESRELDELCECGHKRDVHYGTVGNCLALAGACLCERFKEIVKP